MPNDIFDQIQALRAAGRRFVLATVVRAEKPTSAKPGAKAIIDADGRLTGWIGGSCAEPSVRREARKALADGQPRLVRLCPPEQLGQAPQEGVIEIALTCISGGTLEIYIEPQLSQPHLVVIGHLATAQALAQLGKGMGWKVSIMGLEVSKEGFPQADAVFDRLDFSALSLNQNACIVVASHGNYDEDMLVEALKTPAGYVALIASHKRAAAIMQYLHESDLSHEQIQRLKYPAGLDFGAVTPEEIALSILAEVVSYRRRGALPGLAVEGSSESEHHHHNRYHQDKPGPTAEARDPVCGMIVEIESAHFTSDYGGKTYYFCAAGCKRAFDQDPEKYIPQETSSVS